MQNLKKRASFRLFVVLALIFAALPAQAQWQGTVPEFRYDGLAANNDWEFSWKKITHGWWYEFSFEFKGGGITNVWTSVNSLSASYISSTRFHIATAPLSNNVAGKTFKFRVRAKLCHAIDAAGNCAQDTWYNWAKISVTF